MRIAVLAAVCVAALSGCVRHGGDIEESARLALDEAGLVAGAEAFNTTEGLADSWNVLVCAEVPDFADDREMAEYVAQVLNAVRPTVDEFAGYVDEVGVRFIADSGGTADLDNWCRSDGVSRFSVAPAAELLPPAVEVERGEARVSVPYDEVVLVEPAPEPTPSPTP